MARTNPQPPAAALWALARRQHGVVARAQLMELGLSREAIQHRLERGRLHPLHRGVYAVGRPVVGQRGRWMAAVLSCGPDALLGYRSAAALWRLIDADPATTEIVLPDHLTRRRPGIRVHRRRRLRAEERGERQRIPVTTPAATLIDLATLLGDTSLEGVVNAADRLGLIDPDSLRAFVESTPRRPGVGRLRSLLDRHAFTPTDSPLERRFLRLVSTAGLPRPRTQVKVNGFRVDFHWPDLGQPCAP